MAGYTRQAAANIVTGGVIDAADFNAEYNAIEAAFNASSRPYTRWYYRQWSSY